MVASPPICYHPGCFKPTHDGWFCRKHVILYRIRNFLTQPVFRFSKGKKQDGLICYELILPLLYFHWHTGGFTTPHFRMRYAAVWFYKFWWTIPIKRYDW